MALNKNYITDTPQYQGTNLPTLDQYGGDVPKYMAALKAAYEADTNNSQPAFAAPGTFTTPDGQQMSSAGYHLDKSAGQVAADAYNYIMQRAAMSQVKGPGVGLTAQSRMSVRPDEAALAYNAYTLGESGLPEFQLNPYMANLMEAYGMRSPVNPSGASGELHPGVDHPSRTSGRQPRGANPSRSGNRDRGGINNTGGGVTNGPNTGPIDSAEAGGYPPGYGSSGLSDIQYYEQPGVLGHKMPGAFDPSQYDVSALLSKAQGSFGGNLNAIGSGSSLTDLAQVGGGGYGSPMMGSGGGAYPKGLLEALNNHRKPTGGIGY